MVKYERSGKNCGDRILEYNERRGKRKPQRHACLPAGREITEDHIEEIWVSFETRKGRTVGRESVPTLFGIVPDPLGRIGYPTYTTHFVLLVVLI